MSGEEQRPKQTAFRLPQRILDILDKMVEQGTARTRTDALINAIDGYVKAVDELEKIRPEIEYLEKSQAFYSKFMQEIEERVKRLEDTERDGKNKDIKTQ